MVLYTRLLFSLVLWEWKTTGGFGCVPVLIRDAGWCHRGLASQVMIRLYSCAWYSTRREQEFKGALVVPQGLSLLWNQNTTVLFTLTCDKLGKWWLRHLFLILGKFQESCFSVPNWCEVENITPHKTTLYQIFYSGLNIKFICKICNNKIKVDMVFFYLFFC